MATKTTKTTVYDSSGVPHTATTQAKAEALASKGGGTLSTTQNAVTYTGEYPGSSGSSSNSTPSTITSDSLTQTSPLTLPGAPKTSATGTNAMNSLTALATAGASTAPTTNTTTTTTPKPGTDDYANQTFAEYLKTVTAPPSTEKLYKQTKDEVGLDAKQAAVNNYQAQLNAITAQSEADKLKLVGQGRGITEPIIGGQQAQIDREAAIRSLPVAAQLSAAQGDLEMAKSQVDTLFQIRSEDAKAQYDYKSNLAKAVYDFADKKQQAALTAKSKLDDRAFTLMTNNLNYAQSLASKAIDNGQPSLAARIMALDPNSPNYATNISSAASGIHVIQKSSGGGGTLEERQASSVATLNSFLQSGKPLANGHIPVDTNGYITPEGWNTLIANAPANGLDRSKFISAFGNYIYTETTKDGSVTIPASYKITGAEKKLILGS